VGKTVTEHALFDVVKLLNFLKSPVKVFINKYIHKVELFDAKPDVLQALSSSNIGVTVGIPNLMLLIVGFMIMLLAMFLMVLVFLISGDFASV
jgi:flagellar biosynthesis protein FlhB